MAAFGLGRTAAYCRVATLVEAGLLQRLEILRESPSLIRATRKGLRYAGLSLRVAAISPGSVDHWLRCASTALELRYEFAPELILAERELRQIERTEGRPIFSARIRDRYSGEDRLHRPDLAILVGERPIAIEVELTPKGRHRLETIVAARLLAVLPTSDLAIWATALYAGLRYGELRALRWSAIDFGKRTISVRE